MANLTQHSFRCPSCGEIFTVNLPDVVNAAEGHEYKDIILSGELFLRECPHCSRRQVVSWPLAYIDTEGKHLVFLSDKQLSIDETEGYTARLVDRAGDMIEKIKIFDYGLDDRAIELVKYVTKQDMNIPDASLKFVRMDGADSELVFTYPSKGQMDMIAIGFSVYEDCCAIIGRNPAISEASTGLVRIDEDWVASLLR